VFSASYSRKIDFGKFCGEFSIARCSATVDAIEKLKHLRVRQNERKSSFLVTYVESATVQQKNGKNPYFQDLENPKN
jgi:hypothetical protein